MARARRILTEVELTDALVVNALQFGIIVISGSEIF